MHQYILEKQKKEKQLVIAYKDGDNKKLIANLYKRSLDLRGKAIL